MISFFRKKTPFTLQVNQGPSVELIKKETILDSALKAGINIPNSCRVGGCASCKCKLVKGKVKELTESSYVLSESELSQGYILACQSIPKGDLELEVEINELASNIQEKEYSGVITGQNKLTENITELEISLDHEIEYVPGQYAELSIPELSDVARSYSFASPVNGRKINFYIKEVAGGEISPLVNNKNLLDYSVKVNGPIGDFFLRDSDAPIICIAGGSGLAPVKALLEQAVINQVNRDVNFIFAARTESDLYCIDEIKIVEENWPGEFNFIPVLSDEDPDSSWSGKRGYISDCLSEVLTGNEQAYLCGPPPMIDSAIEILKKHSILSSNIHFDKFISKADLNSLQRK